MRLGRAYPPLRRAWAFLADVIDRFNEDDGSVLAGHLAYTAMLSLLPFLVFATALVGFFVGPETSQEALDVMFEALPEHVARTIEPVVVEVLSHRRGGILTLSAVGSIWAASNGLEALRIGFDHAYNVERTRHLAIARLMAIAGVLVGFLVFALLALLVVLAPILFHLVESLLGVQIPAEADLIRYGIGLVILWISLTLLHRLLPSRPMAELVLWPGILASVVIWSLAATGLSVYLAHAPSYALTYGTLAGVILTLLFFYMTGVALILGAYVNAVVNAAQLAAEDHPAGQDTRIGGPGDGGHAKGTAD